MISHHISDIDDAIPRDSDPLVWSCRIRRSHINTLKSRLQNLISIGYAFTQEIVKYGLSQYASDFDRRIAAYKTLWVRPCTCMSQPNYRRRFRLPHELVPQPDAEALIMTCPSKRTYTGQLTHCKRLLAGKKASSLRRCRNRVRRCITHVERMEVGCPFSPVCPNMLVQSTIPSRHVWRTHHSIQTQLTRLDAAHHG